jgi:uncharacterized protein YifN (PemK superfamily)
MGLVVLCDFTGMRAPEMVKRRPVVLVSPRIRARPGLATIVALSTTTPRPVEAYHAAIDIRPALPGGFASEGVWVKGDMIYAVSLDRLDFIRSGRDELGRRTFHRTPLDDDAVRIVRRCVLAGLGLSALNKHLP